jgi:hypothetical protein
MHPTKISGIYLVLHLGFRDLLNVLHRFCFLGYQFKIEYALVQIMFICLPVQNVALHDFDFLFQVIVQDAANCETLSDCQAFLEVYCYKSVDNFHTN